MERAAGIAHDDALPTKLDKLDAVLAQSSTSAHDAALFAEMLSLPNDGRYPALDPDPQRRRQRTLEALNLQMEVLSRSNPVLMIVEDVHWSDPTSLEAFGRTVDRVASHRVLLIVTFRPEFEPPWIGRPYVTALTINRLGERDISAMIDGVVGNKLLPANIRQDIIERADGIPLFVEEMTKAVLEAESEGAAERAIGVVPSPALAVPASLHAPLMARLDRLGPAKEVAQVGAAIGREFSHTLLAAVVRKPEAELHSALDRLIAAGLLFRQGVPPHATYLFKHALVQDAAYGTLLREPRRALHARIAETLESQFAEIAENQPELLARHCTEAGLIEKAAACGARRDSGRWQRSALVEAVEQLTRALDQIATLPTTPALRREADQASGRAHNTTPPRQRICRAGNQGGRRAGTSADRTSRSTGRASGRPAAAILCPLWLFGSRTSPRSTATRCVNLRLEFLALAEKQGATVPLLIAHRVMGPTLLCLGDVAKARAHLRSGDRALRPCRASCAGDTFRRRLRGLILVLASMGIVDAWLS